MYPYIFLCITILIIAILFIYAQYLRRLEINNPKNPKNPKYVKQPPCLGCEYYDLKNPCDINNCKFLTVKSRNS